MAKADMGQGFKDPERDRASSRTFPLQQCQHLHTAHKVLLSKKEQHKLGIEKPMPCTSCLFGGHSCALSQQPDNLPLHL